MKNTKEVKDGYVPLSKLVVLENKEALKKMDYKQLYHFYKSKFDKKHYWNHYIRALLTINVDYYKLRESDTLKKFKK